MTPSTSKQHFLFSVSVSCTKDDVQAVKSHLQGALTSWDIDSDKIAVCVDYLAVGLSSSHQTDLESDAEMGFDDIVDLDDVM